MRARWSGNEAHQKSRGRIESQRVQEFGERRRWRWERDGKQSWNNVLGTMDDDSLVWQDRQVWPAYIISSHQKLLKIFIHFHLGKQTMETENRAASISNKVMKDEWLVNMRNKGQSHNRESSWRILSNASQVHVLEVKKLIHTCRACANKLKAESRHIPDMPQQNHVSAEMWSDAASQLEHTESISRSTGRCGAQVWGRWRKEEQEKKRWPLIQCDKNVFWGVREEINTGMLVLVITWFTSIVRLNQRFEISVMEYLI